VDRRGAALTLLIVIVAACSTGAASSSATTDRPSAAPIAPTPAPSGGALPADLAAAITADAATVLGVDPTTISITSVEPMTWNDGSLGCPKPGVMYTQVVTEGYKVIVESGDQQLDYRVGQDGEFKVCEGFKPGG
jgi:hypothetical protein